MSSRPLAERVAAVLPCDCGATHPYHSLTCAVPLRPAVLALCRELVEECARKVEFSKHAMRLEPQSRMALMNELRAIGEAPLTEPQS